MEQHCRSIYQFCQKNSIFFQAQHPCALKTKQHPQTKTGSHSVWSAVRSALTFTCKQPNNHSTNVGHKGKPSGQDSAVYLHLKVKGHSFKDVCLHFGLTRQMVWERTKGSYLCSLWKTIIEQRWCLSHIQCSLRILSQVRHLLFTLCRRWPQQLIWWWWRANILQMFHHLALVIVINQSINQNLFI